MTSPAVAATRNVVGFITNLSAVAIDGAEILLNPDPPVTAVGSTLAVGVQSGSTVGEPVTPVASDGSFSVPVVAQDNANWTITCTITGPNIEQPYPTFKIKPPPTGTGDVPIDEVLVDSGTNPPVASLNSIRGAVDYDDSVAPTDGQAPLWNSAEGKFKPGTPAGGSGTGTVTSVAGVAPDGTGNVPLTAADIGAASTADLGALSFVSTVNEKAPDGSGNVQVAAADVGALAPVTSPQAGAVPVMTASGGLATSTVDPVALQNRVTAVESGKATYTGVLVIARNSDGSWNDRPDVGLAIWVETEPDTPQVPPAMISPDVYIAPDGMAGLAAGGTP